MLRCLVGLYLRFISDTKIQVTLPPVALSMFPVMSRLTVTLIALMGVNAAQAESMCELEQGPSAAPLTPLVDGFFSAGTGQIGSRGGGLADGFDPAYSVARVLQRQQWALCREAIAIALAPAVPAAPTSLHAHYIKQTEFDNTPYRFNMTQGGKRMTADDFDAWLETNGYSVGRRAGPEMARED